MENNYRKKKQPELVRRQVLNAAGELILEKGLGNVSLNLVAERAGVSKGGLMHHFPSRQALLEGLLEDLLAAFDEVVNRLMDDDPDPRGKFARAYLRATVAPSASPGDNRLLGALSFAMSGDPELAGGWGRWITGKLKQSGEADSVTAWLVIYAADGMWVEIATDDGPLRDKKRAAVVARLLELTRTME